MRNVLVLADVSNLFHRAKAKYNRKIDYTKLLRSCSNYGAIYQASAFVTQIPPNSAEPFCNCLRSVGFTIHLKDAKRMTDQTLKADWDVGIVIEAMRYLSKIDTVVLCSADSDMEPAVRFLRERGIKVVILAIDISRDLYLCADTCVEITPMYLEDTKSATATTAK